MTKIETITLIVIYILLLFGNIFSRLVSHIDSDAFQV